MKTQQIKYFQCLESKKLYKVIDDKYVSMWYRSKREWGKCCTSIRDVYEGFYSGYYIIVKEHEVGVYK